MRLIVVQILTLFVVCSSQICETCNPIPLVYQDPNAPTSNPTTNPTSNPTTLAPTTATPTTATPTTATPTTATPTTGAPTREPTEVSGEFFIETFNNCVINTQMTCDSGFQWLITAGLISDIDLRIGRIGTSVGVTIEHTIDITPYAAINSMRIRLGSVGQFEANEACRVYTRIDSNIEIDHTSISDTFESSNGIATTNYDVVLSGSGTTLLIRIFADTDSDIEECRIYDLRLEGNAFNI